MSPPILKNCVSTNKRVIPAFNFWLPGQPDRCVHHVRGSTCVGCPFFSPINGGHYGADHVLDKRLLMENRIREHRGAIPFRKDQESARRRSLMKERAQRIAGFLQRRY